MNNDTKNLKDWIYSVTEIYFFMIQRTDTVINEIKKRSKKSILNLSKKEIDGVVYVVSDFIKQGINKIIKDINSPLGQEKNLSNKQPCIDFLKINLKEIQYEKIALYYFDLLVQRQCGLNDLFSTVDNAKKKKASK